MATEGERIGWGGMDGEPFRERAVRFGGTTYILNYHPDLYEGGTNIIAIIRDGRTLDLAESHGNDAGNDGDDVIVNPACVDATPDPALS